jgi:hypothetical protein
MLIEECARVEQKIAAVEKLRSEARRISEYQRRREKAQSAAGQLQPVTPISTVLRQAGIEQAAPHPKTTLLRAIFAEIAATAESDCDQLLRDKYNFSQLERDTAEVAAWTEARLLEAWRKHANGIAPAINPEILKVLERIPAFTPQIRTVRARLMEFDRLASELPRNDTRIRDLTRAADEARNVFQQMHTDTIPQSVWVFLRAATAIGGAEIGALTPEVFQWLSQNSLDSAFAIIQRTQR